jgi:hypothetical protein
MRNGRHGRNGGTRRSPGRRAPASSGLRGLLTLAGAAVRRRTRFELGWSGGPGYAAAAPAEQSATLTAFLASALSRAV